MKFLIIGASGFVGRHTFAHAQSLGYEVSGTQSITIPTNLITFNLLNDRLKDCLDSSFVNSSEPVFGIICAIIGQIDRCFREKELSYKVNVTKTIELIEDMVRVGIKPVYISTSSVYGGRQGYYSEDFPYELDEVVCEYGRHKRIVEQFISKNLPEIFVPRLDKVIGDDPSEGHLLSEWYQCIQDTKPIFCIEEQIFSPTLVDNVAKAVLLGCRFGLKGIYHVANPEFFARTELARQFLLAIDQEGEVISKPQKEFNFDDLRPPVTYLDSTKFIQTTGMRFTSMKEVFSSFLLKMKNKQTIYAQSI